jgi:menaquinone-dependent protoporphyrinogen oxidase
VRYGRYGRDLVALAHARCRALATRPNAFFSVCMSARDPVANRALLDRYVDDFNAATGWLPMQVVHFGGALLYRKYNPLLRLVMRMISWTAGSDTDTSRDHEYTEWEDVDRFAARFGDSLRVADAA